MPAHPATPPKTATLALTALLIVFAGSLWLPGALDTGLWEPAEATLALGLEGQQRPADALRLLDPEHPDHVRIPPLRLLLLAAALPILDGQGVRLPGLILLLLALAAALPILARLFGPARALLALATLAAAPGFLLAGSHTSGDGIGLGLQALALLSLLAALRPGARPGTLALAGLLTTLAIFASGVPGALVTLGTPALVALTWPRSRRPRAPSPPAARILGTALLVAGFGGTAALAISPVMEGRALALALAATTLPTATLLLTASGTPLAPLLRRSGLGWWLAALLPAAALLGALIAIVGPAPALLSLATVPPLVELAIEGHLYFDHFIRLTAFATFPACILVPAAVAWSLDEPTGGSPHEALARRMLLAWMLAAFFLGALAAPTTGQLAPLAVLPVVVLAVLALTDPHWLPSLHLRSPAIPRLHALIAVLLLLMTSRDVRGTQNLEIGRPGPHVIFEPLLLDGITSFPGDYRFALIHAFLLAWLLLVTAALLAPALTRHLGKAPLRLDPTHTRSILSTLLFASFAAWGVELALRDVPVMASHYSTRDIAHAATAHADGEPIAVVGMDRAQRGWHLREDRFVPLADAQALRQHLCATGQDDRRAVAIVKREDFTALRFELHRPLPARPPSGDSDAECRDPLRISVLDNASPRHLLIASHLRPGEVDRSPLANLVVTEDDLPHDLVAPEHPIVAGNALSLRGWRVQPNHLQAGQVELEVYFEVLRPTPGEWMRFLHAEGPGRRIVLDRRPGGEVYPLAHWVPGEIIVDRETIPVSIRDPRGVYDLHIGFFRNDTRMTVRPPSEDDRIHVGTFDLR
ncbi:MAG: hypothetical protein EA398_08135 [Deltaproteobacteria bacterium]|nr:MAG: hypothetical protein EA398_08135 [Deltaproteobacteria bacterium]